MWEQEARRVAKPGVLPSAFPSGSGVVPATLANERNFNAWYMVADDGQGARKDDKSCRVTPSGVGLDLLPQKRTNPRGCRKEYGGVGRSWVCGCTGHD